MLNNFSLHYSCSGAIGAVNYFGAEKFEQGGDTELARLARFEKERYARKTKREPSQYGMVEVVSCPENWWYKDAIGMQFLCELRFDMHHGKKILREAIPVRFANSFIQKGRDFDAKDIKLI